MRPLIIALFFLLSLSATGKGYFGAYTLQGRMYDRSTGAPLRNELFLFNGDTVYSDSTGAYTYKVSWTTNACKIPFYKRRAFLNETNGKNIVVERGVQKQSMRNKWRKWGMRGFSAGEKKVVGRDFKW